MPKTLKNCSQDNSDYRFKLHVPSEVDHGHYQRYGGQGRTAVSRKTTLNSLEAPLNFRADWRNLIACPDRRVINLQADGSAMYTVQALWTMARESVDATIVIYANRAYRILQGEMAAMGVKEPGRVAKDIFGLDRPNLDWVSIAQGMGVEGERVEETESFTRAFQRGLASDGPYVVEALI